MDITLLASSIDDGIVLKANIPIGGDDRVFEPTTDFKNMKFNPDVRFIFEFGAVWMSKNDIKSPGSTGDLIDFNAYAATADPTTSIRSGFEFYLNEENEVLLQVSPYELRATGSLNADTKFNGHLFLASGAQDDTFMAYRWYEYRARWRHKLIDRDRFTLKLGVGISVSDNKVELTKLSGSQASTAVSSLTTLPILHLYTGIKINEQNKIYAEVDGGSLANDYILDTTIKYEYQINKYWDLAGGYRYQSMKQDSSKLYNEFKSNSLIVSLGYSFLW